MQKMRYGFIAFFMLLCSITFAEANVSIGINLPMLPALVQVPGYPVYYAPRLGYNYFFYDGMYWVFQNDNWYASSWYNGPWEFVEPEYVPLFILRIPVRYYRRPPMYFRGWRPYDPPRWGDRWGRTWEQRRMGWNRWNRNSAPPPAPIPHYQRQYPGGRYPGVDQQQSLHNRNYRYQPREAIPGRHFEHRGPAPDQRGREQGPPMRGPR